MVIRNSVKILFQKIHLGAEFEIVMCERETRSVTRGGGWGFAPRVVLGDSGIIMYPE